VTPPSDFDSASGTSSWPDTHPAHEAGSPWTAPAQPTTCVAVHRLSNGGALMRNAAAQDAFGPPKDTDADDAFCAMFTESDDGRRILALVGLGQVYQAESLLATRQGARWFDVHVQLRIDPASGERTVQFHALDLGTVKPPPAADPALIDDLHDDPAAAMCAASAQHAGDGSH
jgi:hypothetical protein